MEISGADSVVVKLQATLDLISESAHKWQLAISVGKCNVLTVGHS